MANISFKRGSNLNNLAITDGQFIVNTAERSIYVDVGTERLRIGDFVSVANIDALPAAGGHATALYYVEDINCLAKWDGSSWIQINRDTGVKEVKVEGTGNAITAASYDATTRILTLTKGETFATPAVVDDKISAKVGTIEGTVKGYVDAKTSGIASNEALTALGTRVTAAEGKLETLTGADTVEGSVAKALKDAKAYTDEKDTAMDARMDVVEGSITTLNGEESVTGSVKAIAKSYADGKDAAIQAAQADVDALEGKVGTVADGKTVVGLISDAQTQADKGVADAAAAKSAADAAQADVDVLEGKVGTVPADKTVVQMIADAQTAATYDDTALKGRVAANETAIATLNGTGEGSVSKQVADAVAQIVADAPEAYDTLKEISDWISSHASDASAMNSQINTNKTDIANLTTLVGTLPETATSDTVVGYIDEAIAALKIGDYAKATDLAAAVARIGTAEGKITTLEGQVATINGDASTDGSIAKAAADTLASAKTYADEKDTAMDTRVDALEAASHTHINKALLDTYTQTEENLADAVAKKHEHTNKTVLDGITAEKVSAWDSAESNAKSYTDALANGQVATNKTNIASLQSGKADKATTLSGYGITDAYTKDEVQALLTWGEF